jgi:hypothetical protein
MNDCSQIHSIFNTFAGPGRRWRIRSGSSHRSSPGRVFRSVQTRRNHQIIFAGSILRTTSIVSTSS